LALGQIGLRVDYFYSLTPRQFNNILEGWNLKRDAESKERQIYTRKLMYASLVPWSKNLKEKDLWPFDWEDESPGIISEDEIKALEERIEKRSSKALKNEKKLDLVDLALLKSPGD
jgi:hypothetical protein